MKNEYRHMMEEMTLSPEARTAIEAGIEEAAAKKKTSHPAWRRIATVAACLVLVAACVAVPVIANSTDAFDQFMADALERSGLSEVTEYKNLGSNHAVVKDEDGNVGSFSLTGPADWLEESDGRLYFTANGEYIDITDKISYEEPFIYIYTDKDQIIHYIAVGGVYDPDPFKTDHGWCEYFQNAPGTEPFDPNAEDGWISGYGQNEIDCDTETRYPWSVKALKEFDTPWNDLYLKES